MSNFAQDIEAEAKGERIEAAVIGEFGWGDEAGRAAAVHTNVVLPWDDARPMLDYEYDTGYGGADCHAVWAWTPTRVLFVSQYDGATWLNSVPRAPTDGKPDMPGGG